MSTGSSGKTPVVIDNGTGYTKMGFAGNVEPQYIIPTVTAAKTEVDSQRGKRDGIEDLDFFVGDQALNNSATHQINYPIRGGIIDNWDNMVCSFLSHYNILRIYDVTRF